MLNRFQLNCCTIGKRRGGAGVAPSGLERQLLRHEMHSMQASNKLASDL